MPPCAKSRWKFNFEIVAQSLRSSCVHQLVNYAIASCASRKHELALSPSLWFLSKEVDLRLPPRRPSSRNELFRRDEGEIEKIPSFTLTDIGAIKMIINWAPRYRTCTLVSVCRQLVELCKYIGLWQTASRHVGADEANSARRAFARRESTESIVFVKLEDKHI